MPRDIPTDLTSIRSLPYTVGQFDSVAIRNAIAAKCRIYEAFNEGFVSLAEARQALSDLVEPAAPGRAAKLLEARR